LAIFVISVHLPRGAAIVDPRCGGYLAARLQAMKATRIQLCGLLAAEIEGRRREVELPGRQGRVLFIYLVANRARPVARRELRDVLWPGELPHTAETTLSGVLSRLRHVVGETVLQGREQLRLVLPANAWIDVEVALHAIHEAEAAIISANWPQAWISARVALHVSRRQFAAGYDGPWIDERRRSLGALHASALECVGEAGLGLRGTEIAAAERCGRALVALEPYRESGYRLLMRALDARGNAADALAVYDQLRHLLRDDLGAAPCAATQALHKELLAV
jgi:DNA-binding SARP family transcriptional activator